MSNDDRSRRRRTVLLACLTGAASLAGCGRPAPESDDDGTPTPRIRDDDVGTGDATLIRLAAETEGWSGLGPEGVEEETNPTLRLTEDETYEFIWENRDGEAHELVLATENGDEVDSTEAAEEFGEVRSVEVSASDELEEYLCEYHPDSMRGEIRIVTGD